MAFHVRDPKTDGLVRELARKRGIGITEAIREAVQEALKQSEEPKQLQSLRERLQPLLDELDAMPRSNAVLDKRFYDELWGQEDE